MRYAESIIDRFGGTRKAASALNIPPTTVQSWKKKGLIPAQHQAKVLETARGLGIDLEPADFFDRPVTTSEAGARGQAA
jgi:hypothetical protein